jgi:hypothetical protein
VSLFLCLVCIFTPLTVFASEESPAEGEEEVVEEPVSYPTPEEIADAVVSALEEQESEEEEVVDDAELALQNPAQLAGFEGSQNAITTRGLLDTASYPYTGGGFISCNTSVGVGVAVLAENYKQNTFGFLKGSDRVINLISSTVSGYFILGGVTYSMRFQSLGEMQYYRQVGSSWQWLDVTVYSISDTNIQFLDETGERGIQNPYFSISERIMIFFVVFEILVHIVALLRRR